MRNLQKIPGHQKMQIDGEMRKEKTGAFDTHPCDMERIENAKLEKTDGVFEIEGPANLLFRDFANLSRNTTWDLYRDLFGIRIDPKRLQSIDSLIAESEQKIAERDDPGTIKNRFLVDEFPGDEWHHDI